MNAHPTTLAQCVALLLCGLDTAWSAEAPSNISRLVEPGALPHRVHVFEDFETAIEQRWWLRGVLETNQLPAGSSTRPNRGACRATATKDFDDKMGDPTKRWKAVVFNPVPGPPMGRQTRLSFRYWIEGTDELRVQIYSLSKGYHRHLTLTNLPPRAWQAAAVDMTQARRPDGSGGPLAEDERIDDIQFYVAPEAELVLDDIVLCEPALEGEVEPFPRRILFTGWFDTGNQGAEWPGKFEIVKHEPPLTWKAARSVVDTSTGQSWLGVHLRGARPLSSLNRLRFRYRLTGADQLRVVLANGKSGQEWNVALQDLRIGQWSMASAEFRVGTNGAFADEIRFLASKDAGLLVDDVLLYEPGIEPGRRSSAWVEPMRKVHGRFTGAKGTFAHFGDSITVTLAFWAPLAGHPKNMSPAMARAHQLVRSYQKPECWSRWKGPEFGNNGSTTIRWARQHVDEWLKKLNPEAALIMFGSNDVGQMEAAEYQQRMREVVERCLHNGTIVILCTMPPRSGLLDKSRRFAEAVRAIAQEYQLPLIDYFAEILTRRPEDWDGASRKFAGLPGDAYQVPTLIARDGVHPSHPKEAVGDYSEEALRSSGYGLRNFLTVLAYAEVIENILRPSPQP